MKNVYEVIINSNNEEIIKRTTPEGIVSWIPPDPGNADYKEYLASLDEASTL